MARCAAGRPHRSDDGASSVEYGLVVFAVAAAIVIALFALGPPVFGLYDGACRAVRGGPADPDPQGC